MRYDGFPFSSQYFLMKNSAMSRDVFSPFTKRRQLDVDDVQAVVKILAEPALLDQLLEIHVGGRNDPDIDLDGVDTAQSHELSFLDDPQELRLRFQSYRSDLIEENRALVRDFEEAFLCCDSACERPADVSKQRALQKIHWHASAVDGDEWLVGIECS